MIAKKLAGLQEIFSKKFLAAFCSLVITFLSLQNCWARIYSLAPLCLQDRQPTFHQKIDQSVRFQFGINGVSPTGGDTDTDFYAFPYQLTYGLFEKMEVGAGWGVHNVDRPGKNAQFGITDLAVAARYRFFDPSREERIPGLDMEAGFAFPTASFEKGLGTGGVGFIFGWGVVLPLDPARVHFGVGFKFNTENSDDIQVGSIFSYNGGVSMPLGIFNSQNAHKDTIIFTGEVKGFNHARNKKSGAKQGSAPDELYLAPGTIWKLNERVNLSGSLLIGLTAESSDFGLNLELQF